MLNRDKHQIIMGKILKDLYSDVSIAPLLGFKGGTAAYFFYQLPRFSVDLDFDLLEVNEKNCQLIHKKLIPILKKYGAVKDRYIKRYTIFALLSYGAADHNIKIEINIRKPVADIHTHYELKEYLGISMLVAKSDYLFANKLLALTLRTETAARDIYDIHFFAKNNWDIDMETIQARTGKTVGKYLTDCIICIEKIKDNQIMQGLGEIVDNKEKAWIKTQLKADTIFLLKNYQTVLK